MIGNITRSTHKKKAIVSCSALRSGSGCVSLYDTTRAFTVCMRKQKEGSSFGPVVQVGGEVPTHLAGTGKVTLVIE